MPPPRRCRGCFQNVELHAGCSVGRIVVAGVTHERIRWQAVGGGRCPSCQTITNGYHHVGCPREVCPACGKARCGCERLKSMPRDPLAEEPREVEFGKE